MTIFYCIPDIFSCVADSVLSPDTLTTRNEVELISLNVFEDYKDLHAKRNDMIKNTTQQWYNGNLPTG